jgi:hypothetical protein
MIAAFADTARIVLILTKHNCKVCPSNLGSITTAEDAAIMANIFKDGSMIFFTRAILPRRHLKYFFRKFF